MMWRDEEIFFGYYKIDQWNTTKIPIEITKDLLKITIEKKREENKITTE